MQIAEFLEQAAEKVLAETVAYARTIMPLHDEEEAALRDHLPEVLKAISADLRGRQSRTESIEKSRGDAQATGGPESAAEIHGRTRAHSGLHITQVFAEYRALRSCVLRLWGDASAVDGDSIRDIGRFNEAIDQALAESVKAYAEESERWRQIFLGVLGHDLRGPLNAIAMTGELMAHLSPKELAVPVQTLRRNTLRMTTLMDSLLDYNRAGLGSGMVLNKAEVDLAAACNDEVEMQRVALPDAQIDFASKGDTAGVFDGSRVREALGNLVTNAVKHGTPAHPVTVEVEGDASAVTIAVENASARAFSRTELEQLFDPLKRGLDKPNGAERAHLGLGLFIVRQIARAHGGEVSGSSGAQRVRFELRLPKTAPAPAAA